MILRVWVAYEFDKKIWDVIFTWLSNEEGEIEALTSVLCFSYVYIHHKCGV